MEGIVLVPIGHVESRARAPAPVEEFPRGARIVIYPPYRTGLSGIEPGARLLVLFWLDRAERDRLLVHPRGDPARPLSGVFATRSPHRPNPIGATLVQVLSVDGEEGILTVTGLDALDGTPVLDLKGHSAQFDDDRLEVG